MVASDGERTWVRGGGAWRRLRAGLLRRALRVGFVALTTCAALSLTEVALAAGEPASDGAAALGVMPPADEAQAVTFDTPRQAPMRYALFAIAFLVFAAVVGANDRPRGDRPKTVPPPR